MRFWSQTLLTALSDRTLILEVQSDQIEFILNDATLEKTRKKSTNYLNKRFFKFSAYVFSLPSCHFIWGSLNYTLMCENTIQFVLHKALIVTELGISYSLYIIEHIIIS